MAGKKASSSNGPGPAAPAHVARILVVEDDTRMAEVVVSYLCQANFLVAVAPDGPTALDSVAAFAPDLIVLDRMLPRMDGIAVCRELRRTTGTPVIMLTSLGGEESRIEGLEAGADDYLVKPFSPRELVLRVQAILRRTLPPARPAPAGAELVQSDLRLDTMNRRVVKAGRPLSLTGREFDLLHFFFTHPGQPFTRDELMRQVWNWSFGDSSTVTVYVRRLREKIEEDPASPRLLVTVWGVGYRFGPPPTDG